MVSTEGAAPDGAGWVEMNVTAFGDAAGVDTIVSTEGATPDRAGWVEKNVTGFGDTTGVDTMDSIDRTAPDGPLWVDKIVTALGDATGVDTIVSTERIAPDGPLWVEKMVTALGDEAGFDTIVSIDRTAPDGPRCVEKNVTAETRAGLPTIAVSLGTTVEVVKVDVSLERVMGIVLLLVPTVRTCEVIGPERTINLQDPNTYCANLQKVVVRTVFLVIISGAGTFLFETTGLGRRVSGRGTDVPRGRRAVLVDNGLGLNFDRGSDFPVDSWIALPVESGADLAVLSLTDLPVDKGVDLPVDRRFGLPTGGRIGLPVPVETATALRLGIGHVGHAVTRTVDVVVPMLVEMALPCLKVDVTG